MKLTFPPMLAIACILGCAGASTPPPEPVQQPAASLPPAAAVDTAARVLTQYEQAYRTRSMDALAALYAPSLDAVLTHQGRKLAGWTQIEARLTDVLSRAAEIRLDIRDVQVIALGPEGMLVTAAMTRTIGDNVMSVRESGILTLGLRREGERWLIVNEHFSFAPTQ